MPASCAPRAEAGPPGGCPRLVWFPEGCGHLEPVCVSMLKVMGRVTLYPPIPRIPDFTISPPLPPKTRASTHHAEGSASRDPRSATLLSTNTSLDGGASTPRSRGSSPRTPPRPRRPGGSPSMAPSMDCGPGGEGSASPRPPPAPRSVTPSKWLASPAKTNKDGPMARPARPEVPAAKPARALKEKM